MVKYTFIIPVNGNHENLVPLLKTINSFASEKEIIVSFCNSCDTAAADAVKLGAKVVHGTCSRGGQLNSAADTSNGDVLLFIHADTKIRKSSLEKMDKYFSRRENVVATFCMEFDSSNIILSLYSLFTKFDSLFTTFGDQVIMIRRKAFFDLGKFPDFKLMEDVHFLRKARAVYRLRKIDCNVKTSAERFYKKGIFMTQFINLKTIIKYLLGTHPDLLYDEYYR